LFFSFKLLAPATLKTFFACLLLCLCFPICYLLITWNDTGNSALHFNSYTFFLLVASFNSTWKRIQQHLNKEWRKKKPHHPQFSLCHPANSFMQMK
jgi:hypothetical protein